MTEQQRTTPAEHFKAAMAAREKRQNERRANLAQAREWAEERRGQMIPTWHPAHEYVTKRLAVDKDNGYKVNEPWCFKARLHMHLIRWHEITQIHRDHLVYYVKVSRYIKIGTSQDVDKRIQQYPPDSELLATEVGGYDVEAMRHKQFAEYLSARQEWFDPGPRLLQHIEGLQRYAVSQYRIENGHADGGLDNAAVG